MTGQVIADRFEIVKTIGQGGMGDVYEGVDRQTGEPVAIKLLKPDIIEADPNLIERFEREGEILRQLDHPNIVKMLAAVREGDLHYLIMEYVSGGSLHDLLMEQPQLPLSRVLEIALDIADALTRAHRLKIIHRDIKPQNVLLADDDTPRLSDFGVARMVDRTGLTETGSLIGTYAYISPEACRSEELDARTDIWSFGVMLFEMLTGQRPFAEANELATLYAILNKPLPDLKALRPDIPPALLSLVYRMLQKEPEQRIASARQVGAEIEAIISGLDTPSRPVGISPASRFATPTPSGTSRRAPSLSGPDVAEPPRRRSRWLAVGIVAVLALVAAVVAGLVLLNGGDDENSGADQVAQVAPVGPSEYMVLVGQLEPLKNVPERDITRFIVENLTQTLEVEVPFSDIRIREYSQVITSSDQAQAAAQANGATVVVWGSYDSDLILMNVQIGVLDAFPLNQIARDVLESTANIQVRLTDERRQSVAPQVLNVLDVMLSADGDGYEVMRILAIQDAIDVTGGEIVGSGVSASLHRAMVLYMQDTPAALDTVDDAVKADPSNPIAYAYRGTAYLRMGDMDRFTRDIETAKRLGPANWTTPLYLDAQRAEISGDLDGAITLYDQIVAARPGDWFSINYRGALHYLQGDYAKAKADYEQALALDPNANFAYVCSMLLALREGRLDDVQTFLTTILTEFPDPAAAARIIQATFGSEIPSIWGPVFSAFGNLILGQYENALTDLDAALAINDQLADLHMARGLAYCNLKEYPAAEDAYTQALALEPGYIALYALRAEVRLRQQDAEGALQDVRMVTNSDQGDAFAPLLQSGAVGRWNCETFFSYDYSQQD